jgi:hypothetical protein
MRLDQLRVLDVLLALGGETPKRGRTKAFWRANSDGLNVSINEDKNSWFDFVASEGGGVLRLVEIALSCDRRSALRWLQDHLGLDAPNAKVGAPRDHLRSAAHWAIAAEMLADSCLIDMEMIDPSRQGLTRIRRIAKAGGRQLIEEYAEWRRVYPEFTAGLVYAGAEHERRAQRLLANYLVKAAKADNAAA